MFALLTSVVETLIIHASSYTKSGWDAVNVCCVYVAPRIMRPGVNPSGALIRRALHKPRSETHCPVRQRHCGLSLYARLLRPVAGIRSVRRQTAGWHVTGLVIERSNFRSANCAVVRSRRSAKSRETGVQVPRETALPRFRFALNSRSSDR